MHEVNVRVAVRLSRHECSTAVTHTTLDIASASGMAATYKDLGPVNILTKEARATNKLIKNNAH